MKKYIVCLLYKNQSIVSVKAWSEHGLENIYSQLWALLKADNVDFEQFAQTIFDLH